MTLNQYRVKKLMTDFVLFNIFINGLFYIINFRNFTGKLTFDAISNDLFIGLVILALLCPAAGFFNLPKALTKDCFDLSQRKPSSLSRIFPKKNLYRSLIISVFTLIISGVCFILIPQLLGIGAINHYIGFSIKVVTAIIMSAIVGYVVIELTMDDYQVKTKNEGVSTNG